MEYRKLIVFTLVLFLGNVVRYLLYYVREQRIRPIFITVEKKIQSLPCMVNELCEQLYVLWVATSTE